MSAFEVQGKTVTFTADTTAPTAVLCSSNDGTRSPQYMITNIGSVTVFVGFSVISAAAAGTNAVVPTATPTFVCPVLAGSQTVISAPPDAYFTGITSASTAVVYVTPGYGA